MLICLLFSTAVLPLLVYRQFDQSLSGCKFGAHVKGVRDGAAVEFELISLGRLSRMVLKHHCASVCI